MNKISGIIIDSVHGGKDNGIVCNEVIEKDICLAISNYMYNRFRDLDIPVELIKDSDKLVDNYERIERVNRAFNQMNNILIISNAMNLGGNRGAEIVYALRDSEELSVSVLNALARNNKTIRSYYQKRLPSNPALDYHFIIRDTPSFQTIIVKYSYLDNLDDAREIKNNWQEYAEAVIEGIARYSGFHYEKPNDNFHTVKSGDTLWTIAKTHKLTISELMNLNNLTTNALSIGQKLLISI